MISLTPKARPLIAPAPVATANPRQLEGALAPVAPAGVQPAQSQPGTPETLSVGPGASDYQKLLAAQLMREGGNTAPVRTGYEGLGRMGQALAGAYLATDAQKKDQTQAQAQAAALAQALGAASESANLDPATRQLVAALGGMNPEAAAGVIGSALRDRSQAAREDERWNRQVARDDERWQQNQTAQAERDARLFAQQENMARLTAGLQRPPQRAPLTVADEQGRPMYVDATTLEPLIGPDGNILRPTDTREDRGFSQSNQLRSQINAIAKPYREVAQAYNKVQEGLSLDTGAGDAAAIFGYAKILDPGSVVRETEFATLENVGGVIGRLAGMYNRAISGERLTPAIRQQILQAAGTQVTPYRQQWDSVTADYTRFAENAGLSPDDVLPTIAWPEIGGVRREPAPPPLPGPASSESPADVLGFWD